MRVYQCLLLYLISFLFNDDRNTNSTTYQQPYITGIEFNRLLFQSLTLSFFFLFIPGGTWWPWRHGNAWTTWCSGILPNQRTCDYQVFCLLHARLEGKSYKGIVQCYSILYCISSSAQLHHSSYVFTELDGLCGNCQWPPVLAVMQCSAKTGGCNQHKKNLTFSGNQN